MVPRALADAAVVPPLTLPSPRTRPTHPTRRVGTSRSPYLTGEYVCACIIWIWRFARPYHLNRVLPLLFRSSPPSLPLSLSLPPPPCNAGRYCLLTCSHYTFAKYLYGRSGEGEPQPVLRADVYGTKSKIYFSNLRNTNSIVRPLESAAQPPHETPPPPLSYPLPPTRPPHRHAARGPVHAQQAHHGHALRRRRAASRVGHVDPHPALAGHRGVRSRRAAGTLECRSFHP